MQSAVIEIDRRPDPDQGPPARRRPSVALALITVGLLLALTGPALDRPSYLPPTWELTSSTEYFWVTPVAVYTLDADTSIRLTARDPGSGRIGWTTALTGTLAEVYRGGRSVLASKFPPSPTEAQRTEIFDRQGGLPRYAYPVPALPLIYLAATVAVSIDRDPDVAPQPRADGRTLARGLQWTHRVTAWDLGTGRVRWTRGLPAGTSWSMPGTRVGARGILGLPPGADWLVTDDGAGTVETWNLATGETLAHREAGRPGLSSYVTALADAVVIRDENGYLARFDPLSLAPLNRFVPPVSTGEPVACRPSVCLVTQSAVWLVDPGSGAPIWRTVGPLVRPGSAGRVVTSGYGAPLRLINAATGAEIPVEPDWRVVDAGGYTREVMVAMVEPGTDTSVDGLDTTAARVAVLDVATGDLTPVGRLDGWAPDTLCLWAGTTGAGTTGAGTTGAGTTGAGTTGTGTTPAGPTVACGDGRTLRVWQH